MRVILELVGLLLFLFWLCLIGRLVFELVQGFAREWRPRGVALVLAEGVYTVTDPPVRLARRLIPPLRLGRVQLDLGLLVVFVVVIIAQSIVTSIAARV